MYMYMQDGSRRDTRGTPLPLQPSRTTTNRENQGLNSSMDRRKRRRNPTKNKIPTPAHPEDNHHEDETLDPGVGPPQSEFIRSLPPSSLIKYLNRHCLLNSPFQSAPSSSASATAATSAPPLPTSSKKQLVDDYNRFALLLSSSRHPNQTTQRSGTTEDRARSIYDMDIKPAQTEDQSSSISQSTSALSSGGGSSGSSSPGLACSTRSSSSFYRKLFGPAALLDDDEHEDQPARKKQAKADRAGPRDSLFSFDDNLTQLVLGHHHQSFPSLLVSPSQPAGSIQPRQRPSSPTSSPSAAGPRRHLSRPGPDDHELLFGPLPDSLHRPSLKRKSIQKTATLNHHGFVFNIHLNHLPSILHPHPPSDHIRLIEDHVLSNFVYSVKTRETSGA
ncbi:hypothetical protein, variant [Puccinia triticina 1-1 BBBD Race 1]|uniref:Uncharacterized protein n=2 Tax=Puccinia triticina TaxID=208348 RepID=A0A180GV07_PUCT1|nr:uncharacterized protein PtA15_3A101 [Puccinia triticina]OAV96371.1 hypothetical protein, variant [Puccinia triticina 1-1 BBBD Race 1]WAQ82737.1 hypothetical protein PtA15_3A101 [Puccinia triticina]